MQSLQLVNPGALEALGLEGIALPKIKAIKLSKYKRVKDRYEVFLYKSTEVFHTLEDTKNFLSLTSDSLNQALRFLNACYSKIQMESQPHIFSLQPVDMKEFTDLKIYIDQQMALIRRIFTNENFTYFRKIEYLTEKLLELLLIASEIPEVRRALSGVREALRAIVAFMNPPEVRPVLKLEVTNESKSPFYYDRTPSSMRVDRGEIINNLQERIKTYYPKINESLQKGDTAKLKLYWKKIKVLNYKATYWKKTEAVPLVVLEASKLYHLGINRKDIGRRLNISPNALTHVIKTYHELFKKGGSHES